VAKVTSSGSIGTLCGKLIVRKDKLECNGISFINFAMAISEQSIALALYITAISLFAGIFYQAVSQIIDSAEC
jgi:hypothetical protein